MRRGAGWGLIPQVELLLPSGGSGGSFGLRAQRAERFSPVSTCLISVRERRVQRLQMCFSVCGAGRAVGEVGEEEERRGSGR